MNYRRAKTKGGTYFFTVVTHARKKLFSYEENIALIKCAVQNVIQDHPFKIDAFVLLPDHFHCIWTLPENDHDFSTRMRLVKSYFSRSCDKQFKSATFGSRAKKGEQTIWQRRFWEHLMRDERDYETHVDYIHFNPVRHGYVKSPREWKHSTFHRHVKEGVYDINWGADEDIKFDLKTGNE